MQDISFPKNEVVIQGSPFRVSFLAQGKNLALYPNSYAVAVSADGRHYSLQGGFARLPRGQYILYYIDKRDRIGEVPKVSDKARDNTEVSLSVTITYRVVDPIKILEIERPVEVLFSLIQSSTKEYIRDHKHNDFFGFKDDHSFNENLAHFIGKQINAYRHLSRCLAVTSIVVREKEGDEKLIEIRRNFWLQEEQSTADRQLLAMNEENNRLKLDYELRTMRLKAEAKVQEYRILQEIESPKNSIKKASADINDWELSPTVAAYSSYPNDLLRVQVPLPELISSNDFFGNITEKFKAIEFLYAVFTIISLGTPKVIDDFTSFMHSKNEVTNKVLNRFLTTVQAEPLKIAQIHYGSPVTIDLLGISSSLEEIRKIIKDLSWQGKYEKRMADLDLKRKQLEIREESLKVKNLPVLQQQQNEQKALEIKKQQAELEKIWLETLSQGVDLMKKISELPPEQGTMITSLIVSKSSLLINNPITPLLRSEVDNDSKEVDNKNDKVDKLASTLQDLLNKKP